MFACLLQKGVTLFARITGNPQGIRQWIQDQFLILQGLDLARDSGPHPEKCFCAGRRGGMGTRARSTFPSRTRQHSPTRVPSVSCSGERPGKRWGGWKNLKQVHRKTGRHLGRVCWELLHSQGTVLRGTPPEMKAVESQERTAGSCATSVGPVHEAPACGHGSRQNPGLEGPTARHPLQQYKAVTLPPSTRVYMSQKLPATTQER